MALKMPTVDKHPGCFPAHMNRLNNCLGDEPKSSKTRCNRDGPGSIPARSRAVSRDGPGGKVGFERRAEMVV